MEISGDFAVAPTRDYLKLCVIAGLDTFAVVLRMCFRALADAAMTPRAAVAHALTLLADAGQPAELPAENRLQRLLIDDVDGHLIRGDDLIELSVVHARQAVDDFAWKMPILEEERARESC